MCAGVLVAVAVTACVAVMGAAEGGGGAAAWMSKQSLRAYDATCNDGTDAV